MERLPLWLLLLATTAFVLGRYSQHACKCGTEGISHTKIVWPTEAEVEAEMRSDPSIREFRKLPGGGYAVTRDLALHYPRDRAFMTNAFLP